MIVLDTPGPAQSALRAAARNAQAPRSARSNDADVVLYLADATEGTPPSLARGRGARLTAAAPVVTRSTSRRDPPRRARARCANRMPDARFISALTGEGVDELLDGARAARCRRARFSIRTTRSARSRCASSSPSWCARRRSSSSTTRCRTAWPARSRSFARTARRCTFGPSFTSSERARSASSSAPAASASARSGGPRARRSRAFVGAPVYLDLWVKVLPNWRKSDSALRRFGYTLHDDPSA